MWSAKAVEGFNKYIDEDGNGRLVAELSNGFTMVWVGYALYLVPLICAFAKIYATPPPNVDYPPHVDAYISPVTCPPPPYS